MVGMKQTKVDSNQVFKFLPNVSTLYKLPEQFRQRVVQPTQVRLVNAK